MKPKTIKTKKLYQFSHLKRLQNTKNTQNNISHIGNKMFSFCFGFFFEIGYCFWSQSDLNCHSPCLSLLRAGITGLFPYRTTIVTVKSQDLLLPQLSRGSALMSVGTLRTPKAHCSSLRSWESEDLTTQPLGLSTPYLQLGASILNKIHLTQSH